MIGISIVYYWVFSRNNYIFRLYIKKLKKKYVKLDENISEKVVNLNYDKLLLYPHVSIHSIRL